MADELRIPAQKMDEQAQRLAALCGDIEPWDEMPVWRRNTYRKVLMSFVVGLGFEVVLTDSLGLSRHTRGSDDTSNDAKTS